MGKASFQELVQIAWRHSFARPVLWVFGFFIALGNLAQSAYFSTTFGEARFTQNVILNILQSGHWRNILMVIALLAAANVFGRSNLISTLATKRRSQISVRPKVLYRNFTRALRLEIWILIFMALVGCVLALPTYIAFNYNQGAVEYLTLFAILTGIPIFIVLYCIRIFSLYYFLLSPVRLRDAFENGYTLFSKHTLRTLAFGIFIFFLTFFFTFCMNLVMLSFGTFLENISSPGFESGILFFISLILLTWFSVFEQAVWYAFFLDLASPKEPAVKGEIVVGEKLPESPSV